MQFSSLSLASPLLKALHEEGYDTPTPIQAQAIPPVLEGRDLLGCAQTGTGKTAAFALPLLHRLHSAPADVTRRGPALPRVLVLSPTRELAAQIGESFATYGKHTGLSHTVIFGGVSQFHQVKALQRGVDILVATPGRLMDLMEQRLVTLSAVTVLVLDEADRMLDMGFIAPIRRIAAAIPSPRQTLMFSATMPRPIEQLAASLLRNPVRVAVTPVASAAPKIEQSVYMVPRMAKPALLEHLVKTARISRALVFTKTKHGADKLTKRLNRAGIASDAIHGNKAQNARTRALDGFKSGKSRLLVATDVAARGLDVDGITHVFNFDLPMEAEAYVHRIGRTGRMGAAGIAISFCDGEERGLLRGIEKLLGSRVPTQQTPEGLSTAQPRDDDSPRFDDRPFSTNRPPARPAHGQPRSGGHAHSGPKARPEGDRRSAAPAAHPQGGRGTRRQQPGMAGPRRGNRF